MSNCEKCGDVEIIYPIEHQSEELTEILNEVKAFLCKSLSRLETLTGGVYGHTDIKIIGEAKDENNGHTCEAVRSGTATGIHGGIVG